MMRFLLVILICFPLSSHSQKGMRLKSSFGNEVLLGYSHIVNPAKGHHMLGYNRYLNAKWKLRSLLQYSWDGDRHNYFRVYQLSAGVQRNVLRNKSYTFCAYLFTDVNLMRRQLKQTFYNASRNYTINWYGTGLAAGAGLEYYFASRWGIGTEIDVVPTMMRSDSNPAHIQELDWYYFGAPSRQIVSISLRHRFYKRSRD